MNSEQFQINSSCSGIKVCFSSNPDCDIEVIDYDNGQGYVRKANRNLYFTQGLLYGAIISSPEFYECNVKRMIARVSSLSQIYLDKEKLMNLRNCNSDLETELGVLKSAADNFESSAGLVEIETDARVLSLRNNIANCNLFEKNG